MNIVKGDMYNFKIAARAAEHFSGSLTIRLLNSSGDELAKGEITGLGHQWNYHTLALVANGSDPKARLQISANGQGSFFLDMVSLMPAKTWKNHGLRTDLAESLDALHPAFMRFPGGNWVEGDDLAHMYHWKYTIGDVDARVPLWNTWGYNTTQGLGYHEYLQLCEDLGAAPLFCVNAGMSLHDSVPLGRMGEWIQDALDAIEYANGPTNSVWGAVGLGSWATRVEYKDLLVTSSDGKTLYSSDFSKSTGINGWKFLGNGNWTVADGALRQSSENEFVRGIIGDKSWTDYTLSVKARKLGGAEGFLVLFHVNDENEKTWWNVGGWGNTQNGIEMGEVVTQSPGSVENDRWYDLRVEVKGSTIKCYLDGKLIHDVHHTAIPSLYASATRDSKSGDLILKVVNGSSEKIDTAIRLNGAGTITSTTKSIVLTSENPTDENTLDSPIKVSPKTETIKVSAPDFRHTFPGNSLTVVHIHDKKL